LEFSTKYYYLFWYFVLFGSMLVESDPGYKAVIPGLRIPDFPRNRSTSVGCCQNYSISLSKPSHLTIMRINSIWCVILANCKWYVLWKISSVFENLIKFSIKKSWKSSFKFRIPGFPVSAWIKIGNIFVIQGYIQIS
jgi:hypothetical protein